MPEIDAHIPGMNAVSFVAYCGELAGLPPVDAMQRAHEVLYYVGLGEARYRNVETYSTGMKQRIKLAQALVHDPDLLFLDEPTNGMDPKGRDEMLELIRDLAHNKGVNLILSSHLLPDVEYTCDHVVVLDQAKVAAQGPIDELKGPRGSVYELRVKGDRAERSAPRSATPASTCACDGDEDVMRVFVPGERRRPHAVRAGRPPTASRCGTCGRACRRSKTCSPRPWARSRPCPSTTRATAATPGSGRRRAGPGRSSRRPASGRCSASASSWGCSSSPGCRSSCAPCRCTSRRTSPQMSMIAPSPDTFREFLEQQGVFTFFITIFTGAGLIANDLRANALQIYLSKPLGRLEYIAGQVRGAGVLPAARHVAARDACCSSSRWCSPATSRSCKANLYLLPAILVTTCVETTVLSLVMLALSSLSKSARFVGIMYAGAALLHAGPLRRRASS